jgi:hypothetical protein
MDDDFLLIYVLDHKSVKDKKEGGGEERMTCCNYEKNESANK